LGKPIQISAGAKVLALQFKNLGDTVMLVPVLKAIHEQAPNCTLHTLVREEAAPLLLNLPWLTRVWTLPRSRGVATVKRSWPVIRALRRERFDYAIDFAGNDRTAILTFLSGARQRLGARDPGGFIGRRFCYTIRRPFKGYNHPEIERFFHLLAPLGITLPAAPRAELRTDPQMDKLAAEILKEPKVICHLGASGAKKEWPLHHWAALFKLAQAAEIPLIFSSGQSARERALLGKLLELIPNAASLPDAVDLALFLALIKRASGLVSGDTGPAHFAVGLGVPTVVLYGPTSPVRWAPLGPAVRLSAAAQCSCQDSAQACHGAAHCLASIAPERVLESIRFSRRAI
jgi:heptosyltransferase-3